MSNSARRLTGEEIAIIEQMLAAGHIEGEIINRVGVSSSTLSFYRKKFRAGRASHPQAEQISEAAWESDKKVGNFDWKEWTEWIENGQKLKREASYSQDFASIRLGDGSRPIILTQINDIHIGSWATDYSILKTITQEVKETPGMYTVLGGDLAEMAIKMRSVLEVCSQILPPEQQEQFLESWLEEIIDKVAFSLWCNHGVERQEKQAGVSGIKKLLSRKTVYFNGIGHPDIHVGEQTYNIAASHKFRGKSIYDSNFGPKRYGRMEAPDREIILQYDLHEPAITTYVLGGQKKIAMTSGSLVTNSGYAKRYFSLFTMPVFPALVLRHDMHEATPFWSVAEAMNYVRGMGYGF